MTQFRRNHTRSKSSASVLKFSIYTILILGLLAYGLFKMDLGDINKYSGKTNEVSNSDVRYFLPTSTTGEVIYHGDYTLSYAEDHEQAEWVAYELTKENLMVPNVDRTRWYNPDHKVSTGSALHRDYTGSGYSRGHLAPAGDMAHSKKAMEESFFMSNISPQIRAFNNGIWKELEETVRDWAYDFESVYVVTGPVLNDGLNEKIGGNKVSVPSYFYKIILDLNSSHEKAIAFLIPHLKSDRPLAEYVVSIDSIEKLTQIDFFPHLLNDEEEEKLESMTTVEDWKFSDKRYKLRVERWNNE